MTKQEESETYSEEEYEVEAILDKKKKKGGIYYKIKWLGYDEITWEPECNLENARELVENFEKEYNKKNKPTRHLVSKAKLLKLNKSKGKSPIKDDDDDDDYSDNNDTILPIDKKVENNISKNKEIEDNFEKNKSSNDNIRDNLKKNNSSNNNITNTKNIYLRNRTVDNTNKGKAKDKESEKIEDKEKENDKKKNNSSKSLNVELEKNSLKNINLNNKDNKNESSKNKIDDKFHSSNTENISQINDMMDIELELPKPSFEYSNSKNNKINIESLSFLKEKKDTNKKNDTSLNNDVNSINYNNSTDKSKINNNEISITNHIKKELTDTKISNINTNINWTEANRELNKLKRKINEVDNELFKRHNYMLMRSVKKLKLIKGIEKKINLNLDYPKINSDINIVCKNKKKNITAYKIKLKNGRYSTKKPNQLYHCKHAIENYRDMLKGKNEKQLNEFIDFITSSLNNVSYKRCIYCENEAESKTDDPIYDDFGPFYSCIKCTSSYHIGCIPGYKRNKKKYEENKNICKLCQEADPICKVNCIHKDKNKEYLDKINKLKFFRCSRCDISAHFDCIIQEIKKKTDFSTNTIVKYIKSEFLCDRCICWNSGIHRILTYRDIGETEETKKREFLVKFKNTSYLHVDWVPEDWLKTINEQKYGTFINKINKENSYAVLYGKPPIWPKSEKDAINPEYCKVEMILDVEFFERSEHNSFFSGEKKVNNILAFEKKLKRVLIKWEGLLFSDITWEDYPDPEQNDIIDYRQALEYYLKVRNVTLTYPTSYDDLIRNDTYFIKKFKALTEQDPSIIGGTLKDYQLDGVNWLLYKWTKRQSCILADEMGLGKTIQIIAFLATLKEKYNCFPFLIIAPLSTLDNWYREFKKWAPNVITVKYEGEKESRSIISQYLLYNNSSKSSSYVQKMFNCHVLLTTPAIFRSDHSLFKSVRPRWEAVIVDEGHCLKTENGRLVTMINDLNIDFKVVLTGTPLQNTIQELFNILFFLDPVKFHDAKNMKEYETETIDEEKLKQIRETLKPYMLRRSKSLVLKLPPKTETIVPVSMTSLQKRVYKGILEKNFNMLTSDMMKKTSFSSSNNVLMELRKCLNHPYLNKGIEPEFKDINEEHTHLIDACAKFQLLKIMLKKLKEQNHRVLIFSTMKILLDLLERFLDFENYRYTRLDGETSNRERQKRIDAFNAPDSDLFIFLLSTRAGGQGINLASADTIIMYDHDWNPQADIQALNRAHRIGQKKLVAAYKLVTKESAEERIIQVGNRKLALDQLVVNSLSKNNRHQIKKDDMLSILRHGAKSLFEENELDSEQTLKWDEKSVEELLNRTRIPPVENKENKEVESDEFSFAKVWTIDKNNDQDQGHIENLENPSEDSIEASKQDEFWDNLLKKREQLHIQQLNEEYGVGKRKRTKAKYFYDDLFNESFNDENKKAYSNKNEKEKEKEKEKHKFKGDNQAIDSDYSTETCVYSTDEFIFKPIDNDEILSMTDKNQKSIYTNNPNNLNNNSSLPESTMKSLAANGYIPDHILSKSEIMYINRSPCWLCLQEYHPVHLCPSIRDRSLIYSRYKEITQQPVRSYLQAIQLQILEFYLSIGANNYRIYINTDIRKPTYCYYCKNTPYHSPEKCSFIQNYPEEALKIRQNLRKIPYFKNDPSLMINAPFLKYLTKYNSQLQPMNNINNNNNNTNTINNTINNINPNNPNNINNTAITTTTTTTTTITTTTTNNNNNNNNINNSNVDKTNVDNTNIDISNSKDNEITISSSSTILEDNTMTPWERYLNAIQAKKII